MAGLWSVKFDHKNGELRRCKVCDKDFHAKKPVWRCNQCISKVIYDKAIEKAGEGIMPTGKWAGMAPKKPYPFDNKSSEANNRFAKIRAELRKAWEEGRDALTKHYDTKLEEIRHNGILEWILDRRGNDDIPMGKEKLKSKTLTKKQYPSTKEMPYDFE
jgi:hypothetical protein